MENDSNTRRTTLTGKKLPENEGIKKVFLSNGNQQ
jgi:hypothetical protein